MNLFENKFIDKTDSNILKKTNSALDSLSIDVKDTIDIKDIQSQTLNKNYKRNIFLNKKPKEKSSQCLYKSLSSKNFMSKLYSQENSKKNTPPLKFYQKFSKPSSLSIYQNSSLLRGGRGGTHPHSNQNDLVASQNSSLDHSDNRAYKTILKDSSTRKDRMYKPSLWDNIDKTELINQRDNYMPKGFQFYEKLLKNENKKYFKNNYKLIQKPNGKIEPVLIREIRREKYKQSDIFFRKKNNQKLDIKLKNRTPNTTFLSSDIFNIRKEKKENKKLKKIDTIKYDINSESIKGWKIRDLFPSMFNHSSINYDIINPRVKNICKTKENVLKECKTKYKGFNPFKRQKILCEYLDLTNVNNSNRNEEYYNAISKNPNLFRRQEEIFSKFYKIYHGYNDLVDKPFRDSFYTLGKSRRIFNPKNMAKFFGFQ